MQKYLKILSLLILTVSSMFEALDELGIFESVIKAHHGLVIFGVMQSIPAFFEAFEKASNIKNV